VLIYIDAETWEILKGTTWTKEGYEFFRFPESSTGEFVYTIFIWAPGTIYSGNIISVTKDKVTFESGSFNFEFIRENDGSVSRLIVTNWICGLIDDSEADNMNGDYGLFTAGGDDPGDGPS
jgi:hypothetical protein